MKIAILGSLPLSPFKDLLGVSHFPARRESVWAYSTARKVASLAHTEVHVITMTRDIPKSAILKFDNLTLHFLKIPRGVNYATRFEWGKFLIHRQLEHLCPDIVDAHSTEHGYPFIGVSSAYPHVVTLHTILSMLNYNYAQTLSLQAMKFKILSSLERHTLNKAKAVIVESPDMQKALNGLTQGRIFLVPAGVLHAEYFDVIKSEMGQRVLFIGDIRPEKGVYELVTAFSKVIKYEREAKLKIIGGKSKLHDGYFQKIYTYIHDNGIERSIVFTGRYERQKVIAELSSAHILVLPSLFEPFGMVLLEAMSTATPVIGSATGGIKFIVNNGETGFLVEPGNVDALAEKMLLLLQDRDLRRLMGQRGKQEAMQRFHPDIVARNTMEVYEKVIADWQG